MTKQTSAAAAVTVISITVAVVINVLTSGWSWTIFALLAVLSGIWIALAVWQASSGRIKPLGAPAVSSASGVVARPELSGKIVRLLLSSRSRKVAITTGLWGAGGFGKTTLANEVCENAEVKAMFGKNIWWVTVGQEVRGAALADTINDVIKRIDGQSPGLTRPEQAGLHLGALLKERGKSLLVVDDVWTAEQLRPFLDAGRGCTLLVTTRFSDVLPGDAQAVEVNQMLPDQASALVNGGITGLPDSLGDALLDITGRWPLALSLTNAALRRADRDGADVVETARKLLRRLQNLGPSALDVTDKDRRDRTVAATLESSLSLLGDRRDRVVELAIFPEDTDIPQDLIALLWQRTAGLSSDETDRLCEEVVDLSLATGRLRVRLHDVIRSYLRYECGKDRLTALHNSFLDAAAATLPAGSAEWWQIPGEQEHLWRTLAYHLLGAQRTKELIALAEAPDWIIGKLRRFGPVAVAEDVALVYSPHSRELTRFLDQLGHTLTPTDPEHAVVNALAHRLVQYPALSELRDACLTATREVPRLVPSSPLPDLPDQALSRVLDGHRSGVLTGMFSPAGEWLVTIGNDNAIRVWDPNSGHLLHVITSKERLFGNGVLSSDGKWLAVEGSAALVHVFDTEKWALHATFDGGGAWVCFAFMADSRTLATANDRKQLTSWNVPTKAKLRRFKIGKELDHCVALAGTTLLGVDDDAIRLWDVDNGKSMWFAKTTSRFWDGVVVDPGHRWATLVTDEGLVVHDLTRPGSPARTLLHHTDLTAAAFSSRGDMLATADEHGMITVWDVAAWSPIGQIAAHGSEINSLAFSPDGSTLVSTSDDKTVRLWNPSLTSGRTQQAAAFSCAASADGSWFAFSTQKSTIIWNLAGTTPNTELEFASRADELTSIRGGEQLLVDVTDKIVLCDANNWRSGQTLANPEGHGLRSITAGGSYISATDRFNWYLWNIDRWGPPRYLVVDGDSIRLADHPAPDKPRRSLPLLRRTSPPEILGASVTPSGDLLAVGFRTELFVLSTASGELITTIPVGGSPAGAVFSPDGRRLLLGVGNRIQVWNTEIWTHEADLAGFSPNDVEVAWTPDSSLVALVSEDQVVRIYGSSDWKCLTSFRLDGTATDCVWVNDTQLVVVGGHGVYRFDFRSR